MKQLLLVLMVFLLASTAFGEPVTYRKKNTATRICGTLLDITTARQISVAATGITCQYTSYTNSSDEAVFQNFTTAETVVGTGGAFCQVILANEINIDGYLRVYCASTGIANSSAYEITLSTIKDDIADGGFTSLSPAYDGATLAEGAATLDLETNEISVDNQFVGDRISLFKSATGAYYGSSCILSSTDANERVTTENDLSALHTVGDKYILSPDAACRITAAKIASGAITSAKFATNAVDANALAGDAATEIGTALLARVDAEPATPPTAGAETLGQKLQLIFQRLVYKLNDDRNTNRRNWYKANGATILGHQVLSNSGNVNSTGTLVP